MSDVGVSLRRFMRRYGSGFDHLTQAAAPARGGIVPKVRSPYPPPPGGVPLPGAPAGAGAAQRPMLRLRSHWRHPEAQEKQSTAQASGHADQRVQPFDVLYLS